MMPIVEDSDAENNEKHHGKAYTNNNAVYGSHVFLVIEFFSMVIAWKHSNLLDDSVVTGLLCILARANSEN